MFVIFFVQGGYDCKFHFAGEFSFQEAKFPKKMKFALISPLYKKDDKYQFMNYKTSIFITYIVKNIRKMYF